MSAKTTDSSGLRASRHDPERAASSPLTWTDRALWRVAEHVQNQAPGARIWSLAGIAILSLAGAAVTAGALLLVMVAIASGFTGVAPFEGHHVFLLGSITVGILVIASLHAQGSLVTAGGLIAAGKAARAAEELNQ